MTFIEDDAVRLKMHGMLVERFQLTQFKDWQLNAINALIRGEDALVVQPTGSGKSLCFQFPALWLSGTAVVITPTVSLMSDQTCSLTSRGIRATYLGKAQPDKNVSAKILERQYKIVFVTPESFFEDGGTPKHLFVQLHKNQQISLIAIDEVHLLCSWSNFRYINYQNNHFIIIPNLQA